MNFEVFLNTMAPKLRQIALKFRRSVRFADEEDLLSEMTSFLWENWKRHVFADKTESYILQSCYFHLRNYLRTAREKRGMVSIDEDGESALQSREGDDDSFSLKEMLPDRSTDVSSISEGNALYEKIMNNGFKPVEKEIVRLLCDGFTVREIGRRLAISHAMVVKYKKNISDKVSKQYGFLLV